MTQVGDGPGSFYRRKGTRRLCQNFKDKVATLTKMKSCKEGCR
ncbi:MAG: hypothetical protein DQL93_0060 (endogenous virus) [Lactobacillus phage ViSo-2018b]|nr:MAG: hypothetical protein DQL93_0060 [Lactobacillus phage ViSo-2018b]